MWEDKWMQHYILIRKDMQPRLSLGLIDERAEKWQQKARDLRIRRERRLKQRLHAQT